jgi:hypothetical protein
MIDGIPTRFVVVLVAAIANTISYTIRTNMSVTIVAMINGTHLKGTIGNTSDLESNLDNSCPIDSESYEDGDSVCSQMIVLFY